MNKKLIRLTESDLHRIVKESVNRILNEIDGDDGFNRENRRKEDMDNDFGTAEFFNNGHFPPLGSEGNGETYRMDAFPTDWRDNPNNDSSKIKAPYNSYVWNKKFSEHYPTPESFWNPRDTRAYKYTRDLDKIHKGEDRFKKAEDNKYQRVLDAADTRPLHRKGSLNRAMD
jgi:hypothetical protein